MISLFYFYSNVHGKSRKGATNTVAEIQAATYAINQAARLGKEKLAVYTDLEAVVDAVNENIQKWKSNNWRSLYNEQPIENRREFELLDEAIRKNSHMDIVFTHIPGHSGNVHHNEADHLARKGAELHFSE